MVCLGNICRSPLAEGILKEKAGKLGLPWTIDSAGTNGFHTGEAPHKFSQKIALTNGIDISAQRARDFVASDFDEYDRIYAMATDVIDDIKRISGKNYDSSKIKLLLDESYPGANMDVPDPWYGPEAGYNGVFKMIEEACDSLIENYMVARNKFSSQNV